MFSDREIMQIHTVLQTAIPDYYIWSDNSEKGVQVPTLIPFALPFFLLPK